MASLTNSTSEFSITRFIVYFCLPTVTLFELTVVNNWFIIMVRTHEILMENIRQSPTKFKIKFNRVFRSHPTSFLNDAVTDVQPHFGGEAVSSY